MDTISYITFDEVCGKPAEPYTRYCAQVIVNFMINLSDKTLFFFYFQFFIIQLTESIHQLSPRVKAYYLYSFLYSFLNSTSVHLLTVIINYYYYTLSRLLEKAMETLMIKISTCISWNTVLSNTLQTKFYFSRRVSIYLFLKDLNIILLLEIYK